MGTRRTQTNRAGAAAVVILSAIFSATPASASVVGEPIARLTLEGAHDSNVLYRGAGGDNMARLSPDLGLAVRDHLWNFRGTYGGDFMRYQYGSFPDTWNHRARAGLQLAPARHWSLGADANGTYAVDPIGLARLGILGHVGPALIARGDARLGWRADELWTVAATFKERYVTLSSGTGGALHAPGLEVLRDVTPRDRLGGAYRLDLFRAARGGAWSQGSLAHELKAIWRRELDHHLGMELEAGPALWVAGGRTFVIPDAMAGLTTEHRYISARVGARHGLGVSSLAVPRIMDGLELGLTGRLGQSWILRGEGGLYRVGAAPSNTGAVSGYFTEGELAYRLAGAASIGLAASRFARLGAVSDTFTRNIIGLRLTWELERRHSP